MKYTATIATNETDQGGERFSDDALKELAKASLFAPVTRNFEPPSIGRVLSAVLGTGTVGVEIAGDLQEGLYVVPQFTFDPRDCTEENGVRVYHKIKLMSLSLTHDPSDRHLMPLQRTDE